MPPGRCRSRDGIGERALAQRGEGPVETPAGTVDRCEPTEPSSWLRSAAPIRRAARGSQGDLKTFAAHGVVGTAVVSAVTVQNHGGVRAIHAVPSDVVSAQLEALFDQIVPSALKTGMLHSAETVAAVAEFLRRRPVPLLVVDPVLGASAGGSLADPGLPAALFTLLLPIAALVTPNFAEAGAWLGEPVDDANASAAGVELFRRLAGPAVLVKGGHGVGAQAVDVLVSTHGVVRLPAPRVRTSDGHGTGCALSASIAARLARGDRMEDAVRGAKAWVSRALAAARPLGIGRGPVAHHVLAD